MQGLERAMETLGRDVSATRAVKALREGRVTVPEIEAWLREHNIEQWRGVVGHFQHGTLFEAQRFGWEQWSCGMYDERTRWKDQMLFWGKVWPAAFCCSEENGPTYASIYSFYSCRIDDRYFPAFTFKTLPNLKPEFLAHIKRWFYRGAEAGSWNWGPR